MTVLAYSQLLTHHFDGVYRSERRGNECLKAKGSEKDQVRKERLYELCQMSLVRAAFKVRNVMCAR
jgi:hypothetical protein